jgi:hypothetical protein
MNFDPSQLQALYQQAQQYAQQQGIDPNQMMQGMGQDPQKMAQALMQFQGPDQLAGNAAQYGIQPGMSIV